jgi:hypothetical protein
MKRVSSCLFFEHCTKFCYLDGLFRLVFDLLHNYVLCRSIQSSSSEWICLEALVEIPQQ